MSNYEADIYQGEGRRRWAVFCKTTHCWYFAEKTGRRAAEKWAEELNRECSPPKRSSRGDGPYGSDPNDWRLD